MFTGTEEKTGKQILSYKQYNSVFMSTIVLDEMPYLHLFKRNMQIILSHYDEVRIVKK